MPDESTVDDVPTGRVIACWLMTVASGVAFLAYGRVFLLVVPAFLLSPSDMSTRLWLLAAAILLGLAGFGFAIAGALARHERSGVPLCAVGLLLQAPGVLAGWVFL